MKTCAGWLAGFGVWAVAGAFAQTVSLREPASNPPAQTPAEKNSAQETPILEGGSPVADLSIGPMEAATLDDVPIAARQHMEDGFFELRVGNADNAIRAFQRGLDIAPGHPRLLFGLGTALVTAKRHEEALEQFRLALKSRPKDHLILNNTAWVYATTPDLRLRNGEKALDFARRALLIAPEDHHVWSTLAEAYFVSGNYERAEHCAGEAIRLAQNAGVPPEQVEDYRRQFQRCAAAAQAMSLLD